MNQIIDNLMESQENGCSLIGSIANALTAAINTADPEGDWSVSIEENELILYKHNRGDSDTVLKFTET